MRKIYNKLIDYGSNGSYDDFLAFFNDNNDNKRKVYEKLKDNGYLGTFEDFIEYAGYKTNNAVNLSLIDLYEHLCDKKRFIGSIEEFKTSLMNDSYRNALYNTYHKPPKGEEAKME